MCPGLSCGPIKVLVRFLCASRSTRRVLFPFEDSNDPNQLMRLVLEIYGDYECDGEPCECCGDTVDTWTLVLPEEDDRESVLKKAIAEGLESGIAESFDPKRHLKSLKGQS